MPLAHGGCPIYSSIGRRNILFTSREDVIVLYWSLLAQVIIPSHRHSLPLQVVPVLLGTPALPCLPCPQIRWVTHFTAFRPLMLSCRNTNMSIEVVLNRSFLLRLTVTVVSLNCAQISLFRCNLIIALVQTLTD
jgi:hypothetical protein